jgi:PAS domain S-box-containing protein
MAEIEGIEESLQQGIEDARVRADRLGQLLEVAALGTWEVEFASGTAVRSERTCGLIGLRPEDVDRLDAWRERLHPSDRRRVEQAFERALDPSGSGRFAAEYRVVHDDGSVHWVSDLGWMEFEGTGKDRRAERAVGVVLDITPRKKTEQRIAVEHEVSRILARARGFEEAIPAVLRAILSGMGARCCAFWVPEPDGRALRCAEFVTGDDAVSLAPFAAASVSRTFEPGRGLPGRAWETGKAAWIESLAVDPNFPRSPIAIACGLRSGVAMPVPGDQACLGVIEWFSREPLPHDPDLLAMMEALGAEVGQFLLRARAEEARRESDELHQGLYEAGRLLSETLDAETIYERMRAIVTRTVQVDGLVVSSFDPTDGVIRCEHAWADGKRLDPASFPPLSYNPGVGMQSEVIESGEARIFDDVKTRARNPRGTFYQIGPDGSLERITGRESGGTRCAIMVPLLLGGRVTGVVQVMSDAAGTYGERELRVLTGVVQQFAVALQNAQLYRLAKTEVAERKLGEQAVRESELALRDADRRKDEFLATLAHELRNPLAPVRNSLELIKLAGGDAELIERARSTMDRQISQMVRLIDDLLDVSRITRNKLELRRRPVDFAPIVLHAVESTHPLFEQARHELLVGLPAETIRLDADPERLTQVFGNLLTNACKYTEPGGRIWLSAERRSTDVVVTIRDTGIGIPPDRLPEVFDLFTQVDRSLERSQGGLGIGLSLVKRLVEMHEGSVSAHSEGRGRGSEFVVRLPILTEEPVAGPPPSSGDDVTTARGRILVVDDNHDGAESLALLLARTGAETRTAHDGASAVAAAAAFRPDVILLDLGMPKMNGYEACKAIREQPWGQDMVIVALTGWGQDEDRRRSAAAGFDGHLVKPVERAALVSLLDSLSRAREAPPPASPGPGPA